MGLQQSLIAFALAAGVLTVLPGLDTALVLRTAAVEGGRRALLAGLGICAGCLFWGLAAAIGLGALLSASQLAYQLMRIAGALYLVWLGIGLLRRRPQVVELDAPPAGNWFLRGLLTNLLNPKVGVFYMTLLPQFVPVDQPVNAVSALMAAIHAVEGMIWFAALTLATRPLARWLQRAAVIRWLDRVTGGVLLLFGARVAFDVRR